MSAEKFADMQKELEQRSKILRKEIADRISQAKELGDLAENFEYHEAKEQQALNESRIIQLQDMIRDVAIVEEHSGGNHISLGATFVVELNGTEKQFTLVGANEANPLDGKISNESPIGRAFMGKSEEDSILIDVPSGKVSYTIKRIL